ncbi:calcium/sodium antiporter [Alkaliflexus imshenetskii]|uniref:calcium/sodium antiporter n=1 Tax=Alkaliflexus imshenetskii TaxID=286730 RepID=UPI00047BD5BE|nr:calcium/sodium antiporter [Alkaliflexus imshenetskii]
MALIWLLIGFVTLFISGNWLVKGSVELSRHFKISTLVIGLTVVAFGTSAPELFVSIKAAYNGVPDLAVGNIVGSNIANIGLILGLVAMMMPIPIRNRNIRFDWGVMMLSTILLILFIQNGVLGLWEGLTFLVALGLYLFWSLYQSRRKHSQSGETILKPSYPLYLAILVVVISVTGLYFGAEWLVKGAVELAERWGVSDRVIGISIVAFGTSIPELATSVIAIFKKENDISVGNIVGSNIFNIWAVLGATAVIRPLPVTNAHVLTADILWSAAFAILLLLFMLPLSNGNITRTKGAFMFFLYIAYIYLLFR